MVSCAVSWSLSVWRLFTHWIQLGELDRLRRTGRRATEGPSRTRLLANSSTGGRRTHVLVHLGWEERHDGLLDQIHVVPVVHGGENVGEGVVVDLGGLQELPSSQVLVISLDARRDELALGPDQRLK